MTLQYLNNNLLRRQEKYEIMFSLESWRTAQKFQGYGTREKKE